MTLEQALDVKRGDQVRIKIGVRRPAVINDIRVYLENGKDVMLRCDDGYMKIWYDYKDVALQKKAMSPSRP